MPDNVIDNSVVERYAGLEGRDLITSILRGVATTSERTATSCSESGERPHASGWLSARAVSDLIPALFSPTSERISFTNA